MSAKLSPLAESIMRLRYLHDGESGWDDIAKRVATNVLSSILPANDPVIADVEKLIRQRKFIPGGRFLAQAGRSYHQTNNCFTLRAEDSREGWGSLMNKAGVALMSGGGIGVDYSALRENGALLRRSGGIASGPLPLMKAINEIGRGVMSGGSRRSAIWAGLNWAHPDIHSFMTVKDWPDLIHSAKAQDYDFPAPMDMTNISVILDSEFFTAFEHLQHPQHSHAEDVYWAAVEKMVTTGEPGFSVDYKNPKESLRNACCEIVSEDDSDVCCLGSINLDRISSVDELEQVTTLATLFLIAGTEYSDVPYEKVKLVREKNRRIGLGLMGMHAWLIKRNYLYAPNDELATWLSTWADATDYYANFWAYKFGMNQPVATRAIAPNGTTSIAGGLTTSGIEPVFAVAYKRQYLSDGRWKYQYVVDPVAEKLIEEGADPTAIEDAYTLSLDVERRLSFQAFVQRYVDNAISSTVNLPAYGTPGNDDPEKFGKILYKYLPLLRGMTAYPDGGRGSAQPLIPVDYEYAKSKRGVVYEAHEECQGGICGL